VKIAICGTHCAGKSTLVDCIAKETKYPKILEIAGQFTEKERQCFATQLDILQSQIDEEQKHTSFVSDRSVIDNCAYIHYHAIKNNLEPIYSDVKKFVSNYLSKKPYDAIVFINEYFPLVDNGVRNLDEIQQKEIFNYLKKHINRISTKHNIPIIYVTGTTHERLKVIIPWLTSQTSQ